MVPAHRAAHLEQSLVFVVEVYPRHFVGGESVASPSEVSATSTAESHVSHVVGVAECHHAYLVFHIRAHESLGIAVLGSYSKIDVGHCTLVHTLLDAEVQGGLFVAVINACHA